MYCYVSGSPLTRNVCSTTCFRCSRTSTRRPRRAFDITMYIFICVYACIDIYSYLLDDVLGLTRPRRAYIRHTHVYNHINMSMYEIYTCIYVYTCLHLYMRLTRKHAYLLDDVLPVLSHFYAPAEVIIRYNHVYTYMHTSIYIGLTSLY